MLADVDEGRLGILAEFPPGHGAALAFHRRAALQVDDRPAVGGAAAEDVADGGRRGDTDGDRGRVGVVLADGLQGAGRAVAIRGEDRGVEHLGRSGDGLGDHRVGRRRHERGPLDDRRDGGIDLHRHRERQARLRRALGGGGEADALAVDALAVGALRAVGGVVLHHRPVGADGEELAARGAPAAGADLLGLRGLGRGGLRSADIDGDGLSVNGGARRARIRSGCGFGAERLDGDGRPRQIVRGVRRNRVSIVGALGTGRRCRADLRHPPFGDFVCFLARRQPGEVGVGPSRLGAGHGGVHSLGDGVPRRVGQRGANEGSDGVSDDGFERARLRERRNQHPVAPLALAERRGLGAHHERHLLGVDRALRVHHDRRRLRVQRRPHRRRVDPPRVLGPQRPHHPVARVEAHQLLDVVVAERRALVGLLAGFDGRDDGVDRGAQELRHPRRHDGRRIDRGRAERVRADDVDLLAHPGLVQAPEAHRVGGGVGGVVDAQELTPLRGEVDHADHGVQGIQGHGDLHRPYSNHPTRVQSQSRSATLVVCFRCVTRTRSPRPSPRAAR